MEDEKNNRDEPIIGEFKGNPVITLNPNSRFPFSFGLAKAKLILQYLPEIRRFIEDHDKSSQG
ncbi:MAG TPA: hypothetical protein PKN04_11930 [bacterium]|jgi:hypothetical protein|nr:hypothetical protein [bacterium]HNT66481.1 hypothetical protein [bacterium]HOX85595.1 hypothetical protein [bacterium]HPG44754.1 hypothetical protein [bacterium]HPM99074.1 hypothetical protein [bacterium]